MGIIKKILKNKINSNAKMSETKKLLTGVGCAGGAAVITVSFIHPIDVVKTRLQIAGEAGGASTKQYNGVTGVIKTVLADEGASAFYKGIQAAWLREASYTSLRLGLYEPAKKIVGADAPSLGKVAREIQAGQGFGGFYKGIEANVMRAMILNATKMGCYDICKV